jgi:hypothetical protein
MKSGRQRRRAIQARRRKARNKREAVSKAAGAEVASAALPVNEAALAPYNSYGVPAFVARGYYIDMPFRCAGCGEEEVWTPAQQKWWYEVAKGFVDSTATRCRLCRRKERERRAEARRVHLEGVARKKSHQTKNEVKR